MASSFSRPPIVPAIAEGYLPAVMQAAPAVMALAGARYERLSAARSYVLLPHDR